MVLCILELDVLIDYRHFPENEYRNCYCGEYIADRPCIKQTLDAHCIGKDECRRQKVDKLAGHGRNHCFDRLSDRLEEDTRRDNEAYKEYNAEEDVETLECKLIVQFAFLSENIDDLLRKQLEAAPADNADYKPNGYCAYICCLNTLIVFGTVVVPDYGLAANTETDHDAYDDGIYLHYDAERSKRNIRAVNALSTVGDEQVIHADDNDGGRKLRKKARNAER